MTIVETMAANTPAATMQAIRTPLLFRLLWISGFTAVMQRSYEKRKALMKEIKQLRHYLDFPEKASAITLWQLEKVQSTNNT